MCLTTVFAFAQQPTTMSAANVAKLPFSPTDPLLVLIPGSAVVYVGMRHQGGALSRNPPAPSAVGHRFSGFWLDIAAHVPPGHDDDFAASSPISVRDGIRDWTTGTVQLNGIEMFDADRVRAAYQTETWERLRELKRKNDPKN